MENICVIIKHIHTQHDAVCYLALNFKANDKNNPFNSLHEVKKKRNNQPH